MSLIEIQSFNDMYTPSLSKSIIRCKQKFSVGAMLQSHSSINIDRFGRCFSLCAERDGRPLNMLGVLYIFALVPLGQSFEMGAPLGACVSMFPEGHGVNARDDTPPYTISVSKTTYSVNEEIEVVVNSTGLYNITFFEGLMVQARLANCSEKSSWDTVGSFSLPTNESFLDTINCQGGLNTAVTHKAHDHIVSKTFTWKAPAVSMGPVYIRGTIVRRQTDFWTDVFSPIIKDATRSGDAGSFCPVQKYACKFSADTSSASGLLPTATMLLAVFLFCFYL